MKDLDLKKKLSLEYEAHIKKYMLDNNIKDRDDVDLFKVELFTEYYRRRVREMKTTGKLRVEE